MPYLGLAPRPQPPLGLVRPHREPERRMAGGLLPTRDVAGRHGQRRLMDDATLEAIAEKVHEAWAAEKVRQGFADHVFKARIAFGRPTRVCADYGCSLPAARHHDDMLPYADLAENIKDYDRACVRAVLAGIDAAGYVVGKRLSYTVPTFPTTTTSEARQR